MASILDMERALAARQKGLLSDQQFGIMYPEGPTPAAPAPAPDPMALGPEPAPENYYTEIDPLAPQRQFWAQKKEKEAQAVAGAEQRRMDQEAAEIERQRQIAQKMGISQFEIDQKLPSPSAGFKAPVQTELGRGYEDPYLAADDEAAREKATLDQIGMSYPGAGAYGLMRQGILDQGNAMREASREQALEYQRAMDAIDSYGKDSSVRDLAQRKQSEAALAELDRMSADLADTKIDSKRLFHNMGTGDKILASIGLILGGFGAAASGGKNRAVDSIERAIERDVNDQKAAYNVKKEGLDNKATLYGRMLEKFKNETAAREATKMNMLKATELKLAEIGARYNDEATKGKVNEQLGKLQLLQDQAKAAFLNAMMGGNDPYRNMDENQAKRYVPGYGFAPDEKRATLANGATALADSTIGSINTILAKAEKAGRFDLGANAEIAQLVKMLRSENKEAIVGSGAVTDTEREIIADIIRDPSAVFANREKAKRALEVIRDATARTRDMKLKSYGIVTRSNQFRTLRYDE